MNFSVTFAFFFALNLAFGFFRSTVGASGSSSSNAPMSGPLSCGRLTPRWSVAGKLPGSPALKAGLATSMACVWVGPPFAASGARAGLTPILLDPGTVVVSEFAPGSVLIRLNEASSGGPR